MPDGRAWPKVSIVTPSYNPGQLIEETIRSVLLQGYPNLEFIIIDGGSADGSVDIIRKYASWLTYWVSEPDQGQSHAVNKGIARATGEILHWINSDDLLLRSALSTVGGLFVRNPKCRLVTGQAKLIDVQGQLIGDLTSTFSSWTGFAIRQCTIAQVATFFDRKLFDELGVLDESLEYCMDSDLLLRFTREHTPTVVDTYLTAYRRHEKTKFDHNRLLGFKEADRIYLKHVRETELAGAYRRWSSGHWLALSSFEDLSYKDRLLAIFEAMKVRPAIFLSWAFCFAVIRASRIALWGS
jgi:glycosyltransferase involved in cell wall biosynthesis